jgi:hypothetical protein
MLEPNAPEIRHELAAARLAALHRSAGPVTPGPLRRAAGAALVRLGLRLGYDGRVPPSLAPEPTPEVLAPARASTPAWRIPFTIESDVERELAAPFGVRVARLRT